MNTHQQLRANLWCNVASGIAVLPEVTKVMTPARWADAILKDFDERFPEQCPVDTDPEIVALRSELETERIRLAAVGVVACADTPESSASARQMLPEYRSAALDDVERRVDECIALRKDKEERSLLIRQLQNAIRVARVDRDKLREERDSHKQWKEEQIELNHHWNGVIDFVHTHPSMRPGQHVCSEALRLLRERDLYCAQLRSNGITPARLS